MACCCKSSRSAGAWAASGATVGASPAGTRMSCVDRANMGNPLRVIGWGALRSLRRRRRRLDARLVEFERHRGELVAAAHLELNLGARRRAVHDLAELLDAAD